MTYKDSCVQYTTVRVVGQDVIIEYEGAKIHGEIILTADVALALVAQINKAVA